MMRTLKVLLDALVVLTVIYLGLAIHYWLGWPSWIRGYGSAAFVVVMFLLWFVPAGTRTVRRLAALACLAILAVAYGAKSPVGQDWIALHEKNVSAVIDGDTVHLDNFRDAVHRVGEPSQPRWTKRSFDLSQRSYPTVKLEVLFCGRWLAVQPVLSEPVSGVNFPAKREFAGNFRGFAGKSIWGAAKS